MLSLFSSFFLTHLTFDFLFQTSRQAERKTKELRPLLSHCFVYTLGFLPSFLFFKVNFWFLLLLFASHLLLDRRGFEEWWLEKIKGMEKEKTRKGIGKFVLVAADQTFHFLILGFVAAVS